MLVNIVSENNQSKIEGELTLDTVPLLKSHQIKAMLIEPSVVVDLSFLTKVDTSGLAWLFLVLEKAQAKNCKVTFKHASEDLIKLAKLSGVESLLLKNAE